MGMLQSLNGQLTSCFYGEVYIPLSSSRMFSGFKSLIETKQNVIMRQPRSVWFFLTSRFLETVSCVQCINLPINNGLFMKMAQAAQDLSSIKLNTFFFEPLGAHVIDVKPQVSSVHQRQHQAKSLFSLVSVC